MNFLTSSVVRAEESGVTSPRSSLPHPAFRAAHPDGAAARVSQGLVVIPTDSATADQRQKYEHTSRPGPRAPLRRRARHGCCSPVT